MQLVGAHRVLRVFIYLERQNIRDPHQGGEEKQRENLKKLEKLKRKERKEKKRKGKGYDRRKTKMGGRGRCKRRLREISFYPPLVTDALLCHHM